MGGVLPLASFMYVSEVHSCSMCQQFVLLFLNSVPLFMNTTFYWDSDGNMLNP